MTYEALRRNNLAHVGLSKSYIGDSVISELLSAPWDLLSNIAEHSNSNIRLICLLFMTHKVAPKQSEARFLWRKVEHGPV